MSWYINNDSIEGHNHETICTLFPGVDSMYPRLLKKTPLIMDLVQDFITTYKSGKRMTIQNINNLLDIVKTTEDADFELEIDKDGDLIDKTKGKICSFASNDSSDIIIMKYIPEFIKAIKKNSPNFRKDPRQTTLYNDFNNILKKIDDY